MCNRCVKQLLKYLLDAFFKSMLLFLVILFLPLSPSSIVFDVFVVLTLATFSMTLCLFTFNLVLLLLIKDEMKIGTTFHHLIIHMHALVLNKRLFSSFLQLNHIMKSKNYPFIDRNNAGDRKKAEQFN